MSTSDSKAQNIDIVTKQMVNYKEREKKYLTRDENPSPNEAD
jgi:hypothetical protein